MRRTAIAPRVSVLAETDRRVIEYGVTHPLESMNKDVSQNEARTPVIWLNFKDVPSTPIRFASQLARDIAFLKLVHAEEDEEVILDYEEYFSIPTHQFLQNIAGTLKKRSYQTLIKSKFPNRNYEEPIFRHDFNEYKGKRILTEDEIVYIYSGQRPENFRFKDTVVKPVLATILGKDESLPYVATHILHHHLFKNLKTKL